MLNSNNPIISNGNLSSSNNTSLIMYIGDNSWSDYVVSVSEVAVDRDAFMSNNPLDFFIGVRVQDNNNFIAMKYPDLAYWYIVDNGKWSQVPNSNIKRGGNSYFSHNIIITVKGNEISARIDNGDAGYFILPYRYTSKFKSGGVLLNVDHILGIDSLRISSAP